MEKNEGGHALWTSYTWKRKEVMNYIYECDVVIIFSGYEIWGPVGMKGVDIIGEMGSEMW